MKSTLFLLIRFKAPPFRKFFLFPNPIIIICYVVSLFIFTSISCTLSHQFKCTKIYTVHICIYYALGCPFLVPLCSFLPFLELPVPSQNSISSYVHYNPFLIQFNYSLEIFTNLHTKLDCSRFL